MRRKTCGLFVGRLWQNCGEDALLCTVVGFSTQGVCRSTEVFARFFGAFPPTKNTIFDLLMSLFSELSPTTNNNYKVINFVFI